jgi:hypothetical protein
VTGARIADMTGPVTLRLTGLDGVGQDVTLAAMLTPADVHEAMAGHQVGCYALAGGGEVLVNWRAIATVRRVYPAERGNASAS